MLFGQMLLYFLAKRSGKENKKHCCIIMVRNELSVCSKRLFLKKVENSHLDPFWELFFKPHDTITSCKENQKISTSTPEIKQTNRKTEVEYFTEPSRRGSNIANIYLFKVNNRNSRKKCEICSKLTIKTTDGCL